MFSTNNHHRLQSPWCKHIVHQQKGMYVSYELNIQTSFKFMEKLKQNDSSFHLLLVWPMPLTQVLPRPQLIFPSKTCFFGIYLNFQQQKSLLNQFLPHSKYKFYQIDSIKSCSSRSFQQHQRHIPILPKFSLMI